jgi:hypothetical protein
VNRPVWLQSKHSIGRLHVVVYLFRELLHTFVWELEENGICGPRLVFSVWERSRSPFPAQNRFTCHLPGKTTTWSVPFCRRCGQRDWKRLRIYGNSVPFRMLNVFHPLHSSAGGHNDTFLHLMEHSAHPLVFKISNGTCGAVTSPVLSANGIRPGSLSHFCVLLASFAVETIESIADRL